MENEKVENGAGQEQEGTPSAEAKNTDTKPIMIPKSRLDEKIAEAEKYKAQLAEVASAKEEAEKATLAEQGEFKKLYEKQVEAAKKAEAELAQVQMNTLKRDIATEAGHPQLWARLTGESEDELREDMKVLAELLPKPQAPNIDAGVQSGKRSTENGDMVKLTADQKATLASSIGSDPEFVVDEMPKAQFKELFN